MKNRLVGKRGSGLSARGDDKHNLAFMPVFPQWFGTQQCTINEEQDVKNMNIPRIVVSGSGIRVEDVCVPEKRREVSGCLPETELSVNARAERLFLLAQSASLISQTSPPTG